MLIDATHAEETRIVVADGNIVEEFDFETASKRQLAGNIYLAKVTRVEPSLQAAFVDYGGNRHGFLAFAEIHPDYYQIPAADREALKAEERAEAEAEAAEEEAREHRARSPRNRRGGGRPQAENGAENAAEAAGLGDAVARSEDVPGMAIAGEDTGEDGQGDDGDPAAEIESLTHDSGEDIRPARKPRARRYKIQEVIRTRQIMLVQVVKEERGNKGAALTTYLSLAGRYCVLMPNTARGGGISRKITVAADRKKLKEIASELSVPQGAGLIIRTAGSQRTRTEIRRDYEYLMRLWEQIRELTFKSVAPSPIYEEGDLIKRTIRDLYSKDIDEVLVEGERGYRTARDFMAMIMPSHARNVKHYRDPMPLFARFQVENYLGAMFNPVVQLKSGGYLVIGVTEALVAIDVNSGRATKEGSIEETAYKTNCEAADEIARQLRLRDLAGLIVIDFIDMDERKHNVAVEKRLKERLKTDRARIQVGRISGFGLLEMSRQRLRPGMLESTTQPCPHCHGTGLIRSDDSLALTILRAIEEEGTRKRSREVLVRAPVSVANFLINVKREHIAALEARFGMAVRLEADPALISPDYTIEKFRTASRIVADLAAPVISTDARLMASIDEAADDGAEEAVIEAVETVAEPAAPPVGEAAEAGDAARAGNGSGGRRRRRRRRGGRGGDEAGAETGTEAALSGAATVADAEGEPAEDEAEAGIEAVAEEAVVLDKPKPTRSRSRSRSRARPAAEAVTGEAPAAEDAPQAEPVDQVEATEAPIAAEPAATGLPVAEVEVEAATEAELPAVEAEAELPAAETEAEAEAVLPVTEAEAEPLTAESAGEEAPETAALPEARPAPEPELAGAASPAAEEDPAQPKRRGWWSRGR